MQSTFTTAVLHIALCSIWYRNADSISVLVATLSHHVNAVWSIDKLWYRDDDGVMLLLLLLMMMMMMAMACRFQMTTSPNRPQLFLICSRMTILWFLLMLSAMLWRSSELVSIRAC